MFHLSNKCSDIILLFIKRQPHTKQKKLNTAGRVGPKETDYSA